MLAGWRSTSDGGWIETPPDRSRQRLGDGRRAQPAARTARGAAARRARGLTHREAAAALDMPLAVVVDRLVPGPHTARRPYGAARESARTAAWPQRRPSQNRQVTGRSTRPKLSPMSTIASIPPRRAFEARLRPTPSCAARSRGGSRRTARFAPLSARRRAARSISAGLERERRATRSAKRSRRAPTRRATFGEARETARGGATDRQAALAAGPGPTAGRLAGDRARGGDRLARPPSPRAAARRGRAAIDEPAAADRAARSPTRRSNLAPAIRRRSRSGFGPRIARRSPSRLSSDALRLVGARLAPGRQATRDALLVYEDRRGDRVGLLIEPLDASAPSTPGAAKSDGLSVAAWTDAGHGFVAAARARRGRRRR